MIVTNASLGHPDREGVFTIQRSDGSTKPSVAIVVDADPRRAAPKRLHIDEQRIYALKQTHSRRVISVPSEYQEGLEGDGMITSSPRAILAVTVGDCLPIFLYSRASGHFAIVHSGWRGTGIVSEAIRLMAAGAGVAPAEIVAIIGPGIGGCCYAVPHERAGQFAPTDWELRFGSTYLDLKKANLRLIEEAGIASVRVIDACTQCDLRLGSYRREGSERYRRMVAAIGHF